MSVLVGKKAPVFNSKAVVNGGEIVENFSLQQYEGKKYVVFFFYPADFTFVCPTELIAFQDKASEFASRNTVVIGASTDSAFSHWKWLQTPQNDGGIKGVNYPLVADQTLQISKAYDVPLGRSVDEVLRMIDALQFNEEFGEVCPANWKKGDKALKATQEGIASYLSER